ncbi:Aqualysin-1 precursor [compost metagenome]
MTTNPQNLSPTPFFSWGVERICQRSLPLAGVDHKHDNGGAGVSVYLVDTGIDYGHHDLSCCAHPGYDAFGGNGADELGNGTFLAGVIAAIAPKAALYSVKILDGQANGSIEGIVGAIEWITMNAQKPAVVNVAIGIPPNEMLDDAIRASIASGITYVIEGGGVSDDVGNSSPARIREGIIVGASDCSDRMADFSNFGEGLDIFAPGVEITSAMLGGGSTTMSGVQIAAAHVSGVVALHLCEGPHMTPAEVKQKILQEALVEALANVPEGTPNRLLQFGIYTGTGKQWADSVGSS